MNMTWRFKNSSNSFSRKQQKQKYNSDAKSWVIAAIADESRQLEDQLWKKEPNSDDADNERLSLIRFLYKHAKADPRIKAVRERLETCEPTHRCHSGACPACNRLLQRWFVRRSKTFIAKNLQQQSHELVALSIIPTKPLVQPETLNSFSMVDLQRRLKFALNKVDVGIGIGAVDFSFNEDGNGKYQPFWSPHHYLITATNNRGALSASLRKLFNRSAEVPRPIKITAFKNIARRRSYALKNNFKRRVGYDEKNIRNKKIRNCRNTSRQRLRSDERLELFIYLDQIGLGARVIFYGAKPIIGSSSVSIRKIR